MKKRTSIQIMLLTVLLTLIAVIPLSAAETTVISGIYNNTLNYTISNGEVTITKCKHGRDYEYYIPSAIDGYPVTAIGYEAFESYCPTIVHVPDTVVSIGDRAFANGSLFKLYLPDTIQHLGNAIVNDSSFFKKEINWDNGLLYVDKYLVDANNTVSSTVTVKEGTLGLSDYALSLVSAMTEIKLPDSLKWIGSNAFNECTNLKKVTFGNGVSKISSNAFYNCTSLTDVNIPENVTVIGDGCFIYCTSLASIKIPKSITSIPESAFAYCSALKSIELHDNITYIGIDAFTSTGYYNDPSNWDDQLLYLDNHLLKAAYEATGDKIVKNGTKTISPGTFLNCKSLNSVILPDSISAVHKKTFTECSATYVKLPVHLTEMADSLFYNCTSLETVVLPQNIVSIPEKTFYGCKALTSINIPSSVKIIEKSAFILCQSLKSITIPDSVESIGDFAFSNCTGLENIIIGKGLKTCGQNIFAECFWLKTAHYMSTEKRFNEIENLTFGPQYHWLVLTYEDVALGDADENGKVNSDDAIYLLHSALFGQDVYPTPYDYDFNQNGQTDSDDAIYLLYHVLFGEASYPLE